MTETAREAVLSLISQVRFFQHPAPSLTRAADALIARLERAEARIKELEADLEYYRDCGCDTCMERDNRGHDDPPECSCYEIIGGHQPGCAYGAHLRASRHERST